MSSTPQRRLPRGRHGLSRAEVEGAQRERLLLAMADAISDKGFVATTVEDVLTRAGVSRESFYRLFSSKLDCFMAAFDAASELLIGRLAGSAGPDSVAPGHDPLAVFERVFTVYLDALAAEPAYARLFLVEVYAAGPDAIRRRAQRQRVFVDLLADLLGAASEQGRFACQTIVSATSAQLTIPLIERDLDALRALGPPTIAHVRRLWDSGFFSQ
ncbi:MAG TPA: TetR/AcrR family transcriptional regulator [Pseudonocardiaceae bacterium]|nr:TetR/AcrR family transcriptional regulator [Pseudonocardiaceae bacterium]